MSDRHFWIQKYDFFFFFAIYFLKNYQFFKTVRSLTIAFYEKNQHNSTNHNLEYDLSSKYIKFIKS